ncbi:MAG: hypothetical protein ACXADW_15100 [Candidatus Hodarchaeales archaeon]|jgi:hypothetical protein
MKEQKWQKLGLIYSVNNDDENLLSHASNPLAIHLKEDVYRIFYSGRDIKNRSSISYVDYDIVRQTIINDHKKPILTPKENTFYSHGITIGNFWLEEDQTYIGFMGWQQEKGKHWRGDIGKFNLDTKEVTLLLGVNEEDKISLSYPHVIYKNEKYHMWYGSTIDWSSSNGEMIHVIKKATSSDMKNWTFHGIDIPYEIGKAQAFSKPSVCCDESGYRMWYSYRSGDGTPYRIGYAHSKDGSKWNYKQSNLTVSDSGWDSEMVCYPYVFKHRDNLFMLYNGNSYGKFGFGLAIAKKT